MLPEDYDELGHHLIATGQLPDHGAHIDHAPGGFIGQDFYRTRIGGDGCFVPLTEIERALRREVAQSEIRKKMKKLMWSEVQG